MKNKVLSSVLFVAVLFGVGFYLYHGSTKPVKAPVDESGQQTARQSAVGQNQPEATTTPAKPAENTATATAKLNVGGKQLEGTFSAGEGDGSGSEIEVMEVAYDGSEFSPATITIHVNDWIFFKNNSKANFWPASGPHPTHTELPGFDAGKAIAPGGQYKYQFTKAGTWH